MKETFNPKRVIIVFTIFGFLWIALSGILFYVTSRYSSTLTRLLVFKETLFIIVFLAALYWLASRYWALLLQAEKKLKESNERFKILTDIDTDLIIIINEESKILFVNPAVKGALGYEPDELPGKSLTMLMPEHYRQSHLRSLSDYLKTGRKHISWRQAELSGLHKNGSEVPLEFSLNEYISGEQHFFVGIARDITERKKAEESLVAEKGFLDEIINSLPGLFYIFDSYGNFVRWNKNIEEVSGYSVKEVSEKKPFDFFSEKDRPLIAKKITEAFTKGASSTEAGFLTKSGEKIPYQFFGIRLIKDGQLYLVGEAIDITERKKAEEALKQADKEIRQAYVDVFSAVTGGKLILMTKEELKQALGKSVVDAFLVPADKFLTKARDRLKSGLSQFSALKDIDGVILAANEALTNTIKHAGGGRLQVFKTDTMAQIMISDSGPGIDFSILPKATLLSGFSTKQTLGMGFSIMLEVCDKVLLSTEPGNTQIVLEVNTGENR